MTRATNVDPTPLARHVDSDVAVRASTRALSYRRSTRRAVDAPELRRRVSIAPPAPSARDADRSGIVSVQRAERPAPVDQLDRVTGGLLGAVAGAVDAAGWVSLSGLLPSHLTASLVILGASIGEYDSLDVSARLAMIPVFIVSVVLVRWLAGWLAARQLSVLGALLALHTAALTLFCAAGATAEALHVNHRHVLLGVGALGVASMAVQNTIMRLCLPRHAPTTVMTGNLTQFVISSVDMVTRRLRGDALVDGELRTRLGAAGIPLLGFVVGSLSCGWLTSRWGLASLSLPLALSAITTLRTWVLQRPSRRL